MNKKEVKQEEVKNWNPGYTDNDGNFIPYPNRSWFCDHLKIIHHSPKQYISCEHC